MLVGTGIEVRRDGMVDPISPVGTTVFRVVMVMELGGQTHHNPDRAADVLNISEEPQSIFDLADSIFVDRPGQSHNKLMVFLQYTRTVILPLTGIGMNKYSEIAPALASIIP